MLYLHSYNGYFQQHKLAIKLNIDHLSYREDCQRARPDWVPEDGVVTSVSEFLILLNTPFGYVWIAILVLCLWKRNALSGIFLMLSSMAILTNWNIQYNQNDDLYYGHLGGCVGSLSVTSSVLLVASAVGVITVGARIKS